MDEKTILLKFGKRIRELRKINKVSQEKLAEKADLSLTFVGYLERAEKSPTLPTLAKIANAFNITLSELLNFPDDKKIANADAKTLDKAVEILEEALDKAKRIKTEKKK